MNESWWPRAWSGDRYIASRSTVTVWEARIKFPLSIPFLLASVVFAIPVEAADEPFVSRLAPGSIVKFDYHPGGEPYPGIFKIEILVSLPDAREVRSTQRYSGDYGPTSILYRRFKQYGHDWLQVASYRKLSELDKFRLDKMLIRLRAYRSILPNNCSGFETVLYISWYVPAQPVRRETFRVNCLDLLDDPDVLDDYRDQIDQLEHPNRRFIPPLLSDQPWVRE